MRIALIIIVAMLAAAPTVAEAAIADEIRTEAVTALAEDRADEARLLMDQALELAPDDPANHYQMANVLAALGRLDEAREHYTTAQGSGYRPPAVIYRLSRLDVRQGDVEAALQKIESLAANGFPAVHLFNDEPDYDPIREEPRFIAAVETMTAGRFPCMSGEAHHAFDFWIGEWDVYNEGQLAGSNSIQPILGHCALYEQWTGGGGGQGKSFNYYDPGYERWRQIWISDSGSFIEFTGEARDGGIFYTAETRDADSGQVTLHRFNFTPNDDGSVRQHWTQSTDDGETWNTVWDGRYVRKPEGGSH